MLNGSALPFIHPMNFFDGIEHQEKMAELVGQRLDEHEREKKPAAVIDPARETRRLARAALMNEFRRTENPLRAAAITLALSELDKQDAT